MPFAGGPSARIASLAPRRSREPCSIREAPETTKPRSSLIHHRNRRRSGYVVFRCETTLTLPISAVPTSLARLLQNDARPN